MEDVKGQKKKEGPANTRGFVPERSPLRTQFCTGLQTVYVAQSGLKHFPREFMGIHSESTSRNVWSFREDVKGKPGWIAELGHADNPDLSKDDLQISFRVNSRGLLKIQYLQSYHEMGKVSIRFDDGPILDYIDAFEASCYSVTVTKTMRGFNGTKMVTFTLVPNSESFQKQQKSVDSKRSITTSNYDIVRGSKFKLLAIYGC